MRDGMEHETPIQLHCLGNTWACCPNSPVLLYKAGPAKRLVYWKDTDHVPCDLFRDMTCIFAHHIQCLAANSIC